MTKRGLCILLAVLTLFTLTAPAFAAEEAPTSGTFGDNLEWSLSDGTLTISGKGKMSESSDAPWYAYKDSITKVVINSGLTTIGSRAFAECENLTSVTIPNSVKSIGSKAFYSCSGLTSVTIPASVTSIGEEAFSFSGLGNVTLQNGLTTIGDRAFFCCWIKSVLIPASVTSIGEQAFGSCFDLTAIVVDAGNSAYCSQEGVLFNKAKTKLLQYPTEKAYGYNIPEGVTTIGNYAFESCGDLTSVFIPDSVTTIGDDAFSGCYGLTDVFIGSGVTSIGVMAFFYCQALKSFWVPEGVTSIGLGAFASCDALTSVTVNNPACKIFGDDFSNTLGIPGTTVVSGYDGSTSEAYAKGGGYTFKSLGKAPGTSTKPAAPTVKSAKVVSGGVKVTWGKVTGAAKYQVVYKTTGGWKAVKGTTTGTSYTVTGLKSGTKYTFSVRAISKDGAKGAYDKTGKSVKYTVQLAAPTVKSAKVVSGGVKVTWGKVSGAAKYQVVYKTASGGWKAVKGTTTGTSYTVKGLKNGTKYTFSVRAIGSDGTKGSYDKTGKTVTYKK